MKNVTFNINNNLSMHSTTYKNFNFLKLSFSVLLFFITFQSSAQFPFFESFKNSTASDIKFGSIAFLTGGAGLTDGYNDPNGSGYLRLTNKSSNRTGIIWSDTYAFPSYYGMTISFEYYTHGGDGADGIAFILFDATASPVTAGAYGGSLGYAQKTSTNGFSKGYLGIGIDEYGGFSENSEGKSGGLGSRLPSSITLRGAGSGVTGYPHLATVQTTALSNPFSIEGKDRTAIDDTKPGFRKAEIVLRPRIGGGFFIDVNLMHGNIKAPIIVNYEYITAAPQNLKFAISSSTGGLNNFHEIRYLNLSVNLDTLLAPIANPVSLSGCAGLAASSTDINNNDGKVNTFGTINRKSIDLDEDGIQTSKTVADKGIFVYDPITGQITFTPKDNSVEGEVTIDYTLNDTYGKTSNISTITYTTKELPTAAFNYSSGTYPITVGGEALIFSTGTTGGKYTATPVGLSINKNTGAINLETSLVNTYIVTYTFTDGTCTNTATTEVKTGPSSPKITAWMSVRDANGNGKVESGENLTFILRAANMDPNHVTLKNVTGSIDLPAHTTLVSGVTYVTPLTESLSKPEFTDFPYLWDTAYERLPALVMVVKVDCDLTNVTQIETIGRIYIYGVEIKTSVLPIPISANGTTIPPTGKSVYIDPPTLSSCSNAEGCPTGLLVADIKKTVLNITNPAAVCSFNFSSIE